MIRFGIEEYVKNILYNIISFILLAGTFVATTIFTSNISEQAKMSDFYEPYLDENSVFTGYMGSQFDVEKLGLVKLDKVLYTQEISCECYEMSDFMEALVYEEYVMDKLMPKLKKGKIVTNGSGELLNILVTENSAGIDVGDVIELEFYTVEGMMEGRSIVLPAKVTGVVESGQKLFYGNGVRISNSMSLNDVIGTYNYEQLEYSMVIIPEQEMRKIPEEIFVDVGRSLFKFKDDITEEERYTNYRKILDYASEHGNATMIEAFPEMKTFVDMHKEENMTIILTNAPLCVAIIILVMVCIVCMISIRNANSMRYYATLYICGMPLRDAVILSGVEMAVNSLFSILLGTSIIEIQMKNKIFGKVNCMLNSEQWAIMIGISLVMIVAAMLTTRKTLKERSPMSVLRDTAY